MPGKELNEIKTEKRFCECDNEQCRLEVTLPVEEVKRIRNHDAIIIVDDCPTGPSVSDLLLEQKDGYSIYAPSFGKHN